jgi:hypothetical protein
VEAPTAEVRRLSVSVSTDTIQIHIWTICDLGPSVDQRAVRREHVELVTLGIRQYHPVSRSLADVDSPGSEPNQSLDLGRLVIRVDVNVQPVLTGLPVRVRHEADPRVLMGVASDDDFVVGLIEDDQCSSAAAQNRARAAGSRESTTSW